MTPPALEIRSASKTFGRNTVLKDVNLSLAKGEVHALLGHNGSGKSTLIKILAGVYQPDPGAELEMAGKPVQLGNPAESYRAGLRFAHQRQTIVPELSAADNLSLGAPFHTRGGIVIDWLAQKKHAQQLLDEFGGQDGWDAARPLGEAPAIVRAQFVISRALQDLQAGGILVLDEPTASLAPNEVNALFETIKEITARGISVLYVTHRLREVYSIADKITLLRDGKQLKTAETEAIPMAELVELLSGGEAEDADGAYESTPTLISVPEDTSRAELSWALDVDELVSKDLNGVSFSVKPGEVLGIYGLSGSGRETLALALTGAIPAEVDSIRTGKGKKNHLSIQVASELGIVLARESRASGALADQMSIRENITLPVLGLLKTVFNTINRREERELSEKWIDKIGILPRDQEADVSGLSGGNRQKVVIAKALQRKPQILVLDDPTAGVDVGAAKALHALFQDMATDGYSVVLISSDIDEICAQSHRVLVLREGVIGAELDQAEQINEHTILSAVA